MGLNGRLRPTKRIKPLTLMAKLLENLQRAKRERCLWQAFAVVCEVEGYEPQRVAESLEELGVIRLEDHGPPLGLVVALTEKGRHAGYGKLEKLE